MATHVLLTLYALGEEEREEKRARQMEGQRDKDMGRWGE